VVWFGSELCRATAEDLGAGEKLSVNLEADYGLKVTGGHHRTSSERWLLSKEIMLTLEGARDPQHQSLVERASQNLQPDR